ncbi:uncharacterized protein LOC114364842 [Ostrinia furnacalis]|uniref:uncharacterized protein LOC114364842 n=1 Tax=Ostrinia furnacalis TaxID=93504 RepID=UPI0010387649|nr:uncharacterized protein LOC114364842 [Ostrinia furnacalis]
MFKIESYITPILLSYVDKYVRDFKPADAQVSLWGGGVALHNLVLKADVLQQEVALPFTLVSGRIHELLIQVPWTKIMSEPIVVTIDTIECVLSLNPPPADESSSPEPQRRAQVVEAPPGYMQALVRRIVSNIALRVHHLIVKYVQDDIVLSLNVKHLAVDSAGMNWEPAFADIDQYQPVIRRLVRLDDLTLCLDRADSDGKIRFYQEPLLYRCQLHLRVLTRLVSAKTRRASSLSVHLRSSKLAWGVTSDQLILLLRLLRERPLMEDKPPPPIPKSSMSQMQPLHATSSNSAEPARQGSWSDWAWSWLPTWMDREGTAEETPSPAMPIPVHFVAYLDDVSLVFKVMELESGVRKRARPVLELSATHAAIKSSIRSPTLIKLRIGFRSISLFSRGKCVCGHLSLDALKDEPTSYLHKCQTEEEEEPWVWPEEDLSDIKVELARAADEELRSSPYVPTDFRSMTGQPSQPDMGQSEESTTPSPEMTEEMDELWLKMAPVLYAEYTHERAPPDQYTNPYDNPPIDFQFSDWAEACNIKVQLRPLELRVCTELLHRLAALQALLAELPPLQEPGMTSPATRPARGGRVTSAAAAGALRPLELRVCTELLHRLAALQALLAELPPLQEPELPLRTLTVEECDSLLDNLPQRRITIDVHGLRTRLVPWDHSMHERPSEIPLTLDLEVPKALFVVTGPLYPHRVCSAACQLPKDSGPLWNGARLHVSGSVTSLQAQLSAPGDAQPRPCARADIKFVLHVLLHKAFFSSRESVVVSYSVKIREANMCGSAARLQAAWHVPLSLLRERASPQLKHTTLARDALGDEESVAIDVTLEELALRGYLTRHVNTHILSLQSARATAYHAPKGADLKQAWLFSAPDTPTTTPYLRTAIQWCTTPIPNSFDYVGMWTEPTSFCADPLLIAWLAYKPTVKPYTESTTYIPSAKTVPSTQYFLRRRPTPPSSSGKVTASRSGSGAELVHGRARSGGSGSEPSERRDNKQSQQTQTPAQSIWWDGSALVRLHARLRAALVSVELGLALLYLASTSASAVDCATVRDAMERHAAEVQPVLVLSLGRLSMHSNSSKKHLWQEIRHDGPTFLTNASVSGGPTDQPRPEDDSFPWRLRLADVSCYTLEVRFRPEVSSRDRMGGLRSQLKMTHAMPKTMLELITTTVTISVVTRSMQIRTSLKKEPKKHHMETSTEEDKLKYFTSGIDFKPSTLKEFFRGPAKRKKSRQEMPKETQPEEPAAPTTVSGPVVSLGVHLHADTPPVVLRLDHEQVHLVASALHGLQHIVTLLQRPPIVPSKYSYSSLGGSHRSLIRSVSELEEVESESDTPSEEKSGLISIYESQSRSDNTFKMKTFFWFQWVVSRATLVVATQNVKFVFDADDIMSTVDLQSHYNQLKIKIASASVRHYERTGSTEWTAGVLGGRVLEAREPTNAKEENYFMSVTITQAQISNLPSNWKEELHPKLLEQKTGIDSMWEIYATVAPLEAVIQPTILENVVSLIQEFAPRSFCPLSAEVAQRPSNWQWPFLYVSAGGLRLLITSEDEDTNADDTFMIVLGKVTVNPHPENPICRRAVGAVNDSGWVGSGGPFEGRQYEVLITNFSVRSAQFSQLVFQEASEKEMMQGTVGENPALKWTQPIVSPTITSMLHPVDIGCVLAPAVFVTGALASGPAVELNLVSDCALDVSVQQLALLQRVLGDVTHALHAHKGPGLVIYEEDEKCPYASLLMQSTGFEDLPSLQSDSLSNDETLKGQESEAGGGVAGTSGATDSGVDTAASHSTLKSSPRAHADLSAGLKKSMSVAFVDHLAEASDYLEVFVTMGTIEVSLYTEDDSSPEVIALRPPPMSDSPPPPEPVQVNVIFDQSVPNPEDLSSDDSKTRSLTETIRHAEAAKSIVDVHNLARERRGDGCLPLMHVTLHQPNLYYWRRKAQKSLQVSLFNAWVGLGAGLNEKMWNAPLFSTAQGAPDPVTDIPPALATMKATAPVATGSNTKGTIRLDVERPVQLEVCTDRLRRLRGIMALIQDKISRAEDIETPVVQLPILYRLRRFMIHQAIESITIQTSQLSVCGAEGAAGCDGASVQLAAGARPERVCARALLSALLLAAGPPGDRRHVLLQPVTLGCEMEAVWESWRRSEGGTAACEPTVRVGLDLDRVTVDLRPDELAAAGRIRQALRDLAVGTDVIPPAPANSADTFYRQRGSRLRQSSSLNFSQQHLRGVALESEPGDHYYKDDLRSGAFKMVSGGQLPMAYQVTLHGPAVAWRYPHPRAITRIVAFPLPEMESEVECVLELYSPMLQCWHAHTYFRLPLVGPREIQLCTSAPDTVFAQMWRFRACVENEPVNRPFEFNIYKYMPKKDPLLSDYQPEMEYPVGRVPVSAEQLSCAVRVDSYFAPRALPRLRVAARLATLELHAHNSLPFLSSQVTSLEGYYVSRPLMRGHRVLTLLARDAAAHAHFGSPAGYTALLAAGISSDILDCATGTMEQLVDEFRFQGAVSVPLGQLERARFRSCATAVHVSLHVPRLRTLHSLATDWRTAMDQYVCESASTEMLDEETDSVVNNRELAAVTAAALDGRVALWIHNSCAAALRLGQEGSDEIVPLQPGARLAYRWRSPTAPKRIRLALAGPTADWHWSSSVPFTAGTHRVRLEDAEALGGKSSPGGGVYAHVKVEECGARRNMQLAGRLTLANMLRYSLLYKVRARCPEEVHWGTVCSGELEPESVGRSVIAGADCEMALKIKFTTHDIGWSGDIPLKECPKENVPWLVKVPSQGEVPYVSVWCRVVRARSDGRILATIWPLYVLHSHLTLDTDVLIVTEATVSYQDIADETNSAPLVQTAPGRGASTHLVAPGTTAARHELSFQYRNIDCPVTREAVPMHYGVTDASVFDKRAPVTTIDEVTDEILQWLERSGRDATSQWPYSLVSKHWPAAWQPALMQPRCDVTVRYQAVRAGGGCCLELQLCPLVLLCNAAPIALTLRAHDAAPLCKLESGTAISPPSAVLKKPFFMSVEIGRETFVSGQLLVSDAPPGRYTSPPPGHVTLDRACPFAIHCNHKVALLTMYYEIKHEINVLGISPTYVLINSLNTDILVSAVAVPIEPGMNVDLRPKTFKVVEPTKEGSIHGMPLCRFWLRGRWHGGGAPSELAAFLCVALPDGGYPAAAPVPVRLGEPPLRRALSLTDVENKPVAVVVTQMQHEGRWLVAVARDPCPQLLVHNRSHAPLAVAQPVEGGPGVVPECAGARWWCSVPAGGVTHYSSPAHCARYPPPPGAEPPASLPLLVLARDTESGVHAWSASLALAPIDGEQLVQLSAGLTVKARVRSHPHSTLLELHDVQQNDISASDIRKRLLEPYLSTETVSIQRKETKEIEKTSSHKLTRTGADEKLLDTAIAPDETAESALDVIEADTATLVEATELAKQASGTQVSVPILPLEQEPVAGTSADNLEVVKDAKLSEDKGDIGWSEDAPWAACERARIVVSSLGVELASSAEARPLLALHVCRAALLVLSEPKRTKTTLSVAGFQVDNLQYESGQFDFGVVASTPTETKENDDERWPPLWSMLVERNAFDVREDTARVLVRLQQDTWPVMDTQCTELTEVEISLGPLALYVEDAYVSALVALARLAAAPAPLGDAGAALAELHTLQAPLRLQALHLRPLDLTLTLHTAVRMYIALDQSPLRLGAFRLQRVMTSAERLTHALTVHYLSAAILGAGWVVGGLELLGAPGALAARVGGASGGVRGVASAAAAALVRSLSAWAGSLARNLDLLAGDEEHARRAAAARRKPPPSLMAGLSAGLTNFAINILGKNL